MSGNPLALAVGFETLKMLKAPGFYQALSAKREKLRAGIAAAAAKHSIAILQSAIGSMFGTFFNDQPVTDFDSAKKSDTEAFKIFFRALLKEGVYIAPSQFETGFVSAAHSEADIDATFTAAEKAFAAVRMQIGEGKKQVS